MEVNSPNYTQWEYHFKNMAQGKLKSNGKLMVVDKPQSGGGSTIQLVSPAEQIDAMAREKVKAIRRKYVQKRKVIKRKGSSKKTQSTPKHRRVKVAKRKRQWLLKSGSTVMMDTVNS